MARHGIVTLLTDFGIRGPYVAAMKGALLRHCPAARIVDICHDIEAHDVLQASFVLAQAAEHFPAGTVHVVVVDPGVGTGREIIAAAFGQQTYLFPDNGVITMVAEAQPLQAMAVVRNPKYLPSEQAVSSTFHGRDLFAPLAGHLVRGTRITDLGPMPETYKLIDVSKPFYDDDEIVGSVVYVDRFGNLISNITARILSRRWPDPNDAEVLCDATPVGPVRATYGQTDRGQLLALINSMGLVEVAANTGRACDVLGAGVGSEVRLRRRTPDPQRPAR